MNIAFIVVLCFVTGALASPVNPPKVDVNFNGSGKLTIDPDVPSQDNLQFSMAGSSSALRIDVFGTVSGTGGAPTVVNSTSLIGPVTSYLIDHTSNACTSTPSPWPAFSGVWSVLVASQGECQSQNVSGINYFGEAYPETPPFIVQTCVDQSDEQKPRPLNVQFGYRGVEQVYELESFGTGENPPGTFDVPATCTMN